MEAGSDGHSHSATEVLVGHVSFTLSWLPGVCREAQEQASTTAAGQTSFPLIFPLSMSADHHRAKALRKQTVFIIDQFSLGIPSTTAERCLAYQNRAFGILSRVSHYVKLPLPRPVFRPTYQTSSRPDRSVSCCP